jgi:hypothetical protein
MSNHQFVALVSLLFSFPVFGDDLFRGNIDAINKAGKPMTWQFDVAYSIDESMSLNGNLTVWGASPCKGPQKIEGFSDGNTIEFKVIESSMKGCGGNQFIGKVKSDSIVGKYFFQGIFHEVIFKKQMAK